MKGTEISLHPLVLTMRRRARQNVLEGAGRCLLLPWPLQGKSWPFLRAVSKLPTPPPRAQALLLSPRPSPPLGSNTGLCCGPWTSPLACPRHHGNTPVQGQVRLMLYYFLVMAIVMLIVYGNRQEEPMQTSFGQSVTLGRSKLEKRSRSKDPELNLLMCLVSDRT